ncbi:MAG: DinB family protein [bacterium]|nr:DinB family protein [bacterium]
MHIIVAELEKQYLAALRMWEQAVEICPEELWLMPPTTAPYWRQAYHCIFWLHNFLGGKDKAFDFRPFGVDVDPRLFNVAPKAIGQSDALEYGRQTRRWIGEVFEALPFEELTAASAFENGQFSTVIQRLLYGLGHARHHIGGLAAALRFHRLTNQSGVR